MNKKKDTHNVSRSIGIFRILIKIQLLITFLGIPFSIFIILRAIYFLVNSSEEINLFEFGFKIIIGMIYVLFLCIPFCIIIIFNKNIEKRSFILYVSMMLFFILSTLSFFIVILGGIQSIIETPENWISSSFSYPEIILRLALVLFIVFTILLNVWILYILIFSPDVKNYYINNSKIF